MHNDFIDSMKDVCTVIDHFIGTRNNNNGKRSFRYMAAKNYNELPLNLRDYSMITEGN